MNRLYAPWRSLYQRLTLTNKHKSDNCPFCIIILSESDQENYIVKRYNTLILLLNKFPYNAGHLLIVPNQHTPTLNTLETNAQSELISVASISTTILAKELDCQGFNIGVNIGGSSAGGSIPEHIHMHIVPRFEGDTNFLVATADTKLISHDFNTIYKRLRAAFNT